MSVFIIGLEKIGVFTTWDYTKPPYLTVMSNDNEFILFYIVWWENRLTIEKILRFVSFIQICIILISQDIMEYYK